MTTGLFFLAGLILLVAGAEFLVRGASRLAAAARISPLVVGLTVVAWGTSTPELVVSLQSTVAGQPDLAIGNVVGSNIFNVLFILGLAALITPLHVAQQLVRWDVPLMVGISVLLSILVSDGSLGRLEGLVLVAGMIACAAWSIRVSRREAREVREEYDEAYATPPGSRTMWNVLLVAGGLALLVVGARWVVDAAVSMARALDVSELVIGLTIVAAGTSLPEVATSVVAAIRGERDIAVGNVVGSNIFNILAVLGASAAVSADGLPVSPAVLRFDLPVMIAAAIACLTIFFTGHLVARWEGAVFLAYYAAYTAYLILDSTGHDALPAFASMMLLFVAPLTVLTLAIALLRERAERRRGPVATR